MMYSILKVEIPCSCPSSNRLDASNLGLDYYQSYHPYYGQMQSYMSGFPGYSNTASAATNSATNPTTTTSSSLAGTPKPDNAFFFTTLESLAKSRHLPLDRLLEGTSLYCSSFFPLFAAAEGTGAVFQMMEVY